MTSGFLRLAEELVASNVDGLNRLFWQAGAEEPTIVWDPEAEDCAFDTHRRLLAHWKSLPRKGACPVVELIDPVDFPYALGYIMLVDVLEDGTDFRYRLYGSAIAATYGRDMTGRRTSEFGGHITAFFVAVYQAILMRIEPMLTVHEPPPSVYVKSWHRLILPFTDSDDGPPVRFLVCNLPERPVFRRYAADPPP